MTNLELVASLKILKVIILSETIHNYRFMLSKNPILIIYINKEYNTYQLTTSLINYLSLHEIDITNITLQMLMEDIDEEKTNI